MTKVEYFGLLHRGESRPPYLKKKMNALDKIRLAGFEVAAREGIVGGEKLANVPPASDAVDDLVCRVMDDFNAFNTLAQFDAEGYD